MPDRPTLVLVTGPPGTGKSTLAETAAESLGASVLAWDWVMAGLMPYDTVQAALRALDRPTHRSVGWSMLGSLALAQLRAGRSVVLDGCARHGEVEGTRRLAASAGAGCVVVVTSCRDVALHRSRIEGRVRHIPGWYELDWDHVAGFLERWDPPEGDVCLDAADPLAANVAALIGIVGIVGTTGRARTAPTVRGSDRTDTDEVRPRPVASATTGSDVSGPAIVQLIGYPGTGKRTIASALVAAVPRDDRRYVLVDNHLTGTPILGVLDVDGTDPVVDDEVWRRVAMVRAIAHDAIRDLAPPGWSFVFTNVVTDASVEPSVERLRTLAADRGAAYVPVVVDCDPLERRRRVAAPDRRVHRKWIDPDQVEAFVAAHELVRPDDPHRLDLDVTHLEPASAAAVILEHVRRLAR